MRKLRMHTSPTGPKLVEVPKLSLFIRGPIPVAWLAAVAKLPGKTLNVALAIQWLAGMGGGKPIKLTRRSQELFAISDDAAQDGLQRLEAAELVTATRLPGQRPLITILKV